MADATEFPAAAPSRRVIIPACAGPDASLLGSDPDPGGGRVVTYRGWPPYTYENDARPGQAAGQVTASDGGDWYVLRPSGAPLIPAPQP